MIRVGDFVRLKALPSDFARWQRGEATDIFQYCLGRAYRVDEIDERGLIVLDVSADIDPLFGGFMNDIRVEERCVEIIAGTKDNEHA